MLSVCTFQLLFFDDESKRAAFVKHLRQGVTDIGQEIREKEMREEELLKEALTREQRAQIVETFIRHAFSKVQSAAADLSSAAKCCQSSFEVELGLTFKAKELIARPRWTCSNVKLTLEVLLMTLR